MIQTGDPLGTGSGDAGYKFKDEINDLRFDEVEFCMANNGPATNSSQFYYARCYTLARREAYHFGHVVEEGMNVVNLIEQTIISKKSYNHKKRRGCKEV
jgi:peptidylprolyl isomerase